jgi:hypothetical protein
LKSYLEELRGHGMVDEEVLPRLTAKGHQFLECYQAWIRVQELYGIESPGLAPGFVGRMQTH